MIHHGASHPNGSSGAALGASRRLAFAEDFDTLPELLDLEPAARPDHVYASGDPEVRELTFGILPLTDCAPLVVAHERGLFRKHGIVSSIAKAASWTASRDALLSGATHAAHMLLGMPVAAAVGKLGTDQKPLIAPWILNRSGQAITLHSRHQVAAEGGAAALRPIAHAARDKGRPLVFGITLAPGTHAMWMRYWLASGGIHPDKDVALITVPPPQMVANLRAGRMDGFCVGEPWNASAAAEGIGFTAAFTEEIWPDHPEKVLAFSEEFAEANPNSVKATLKAVHEASIWCDAPIHRDELAELLARPAYLNCPKEVIAARLPGAVDDRGIGRAVGGRRGLNFHARGANYPQAKYAVWLLSQFRRWAMLPVAPDYFGVARRVMRPEFYEAAMAELGVAHGGADLAPEMLGDGKSFDPAKPEEYAAGFEISALRKS